jgi:starch phosphorylase
MARLDIEMSRESDWCDGTELGKPHGRIAYFSAEFAIHNSLPIYAGGLGVLAGDICKEASDRGLPLVGIGFMYPQGYFHQHISVEGEQQEVYRQLDFQNAPISPCAWPYGCGPLIPVQLADRTIYVKVWQVRVGRTNLYLLDTNVEENVPQDRQLSARLYTADQEERLCQLYILGVGGVRMLRELQITPTVWHANEDHTAFMMFERLREEISKGTPYETAIEKVRKNTVFTTHTPVPAGHHVFPTFLLDRYAKNLWESLRIDKETFLSMGQYNGISPDKFNLTAFALRLASSSNSVSKLHGIVTRKMWQILWPEKNEEETPILSITNGVHLPSWQAPEIIHLCQKYLGSEMLRKQANEEYWNCLTDISDQELWQVHQTLKTRLINAIQERIQARWTEEAVTSQQVVAMGSMLDPYALTIAFARRFAEYKRPYLLLSDIERLKKIVIDDLHPVQIIFAGKSHPADYQSKQLLKQVHNLAMDRSFQGRIAFVEDYDLTLARDLVRGVDVWLNTPRRLQEACGTSGMKASLNGVLNLSVRDGWWDEGYNGKNGWSIDEFKSGTPQEQDKVDAENIYRLLENEIVPLYYDRDRFGVPHRWIKTAKEAIRTIAPLFNACHMMKEYTQNMYLPVTK